MAKEYSVGSKSDVDSSGPKVKYSKPGAARFGNFCDYYRFNPVSERAKILSDLHWQVFVSDHTNVAEKETVDADQNKQCNRNMSSVENQESSSSHPSRSSSVTSRECEKDEKSRCFVYLDVGCNCGDLTAAFTDQLQDHVTSALPHTQVKTLGIDIDTVLIERAVEKYNTDPFLTFQCADITTDDVIENLTSQLSANGRDRFDVISCFAITMWVHLNKGDAGLQLFLRTVSSLCDNLIIEPQPWKCYRQAVRRMKRLGGEPFPEFDGLTMRNDVDACIVEYLARECGMVVVKELGTTHWDRKVVQLRRSGLL